jgi:hypothetical protein
MTGVKCTASESTDNDLRHEPWEALFPPIKPSKELKEKALSAVSARSAPTRKVVARQTAALSIGSWLITLVVFVYAGGPRVLGRPLSLVIGTALGIAAVAAVSAWAALGRGDSTLGRARQWLVPVVIGSPAVILAWKLFWSAQYGSVLEHWPGRPGFRCLALSLSLGICPLVAFAIARRRSDPRRPILTGFAAGVAIGCITSLLTDFWCPVAYVPHLLLGHLLPIALLGALGALMGGQVIALRGE